MEHGRRPLPQGIPASHSSHTLPLLIICIGILLRLAQYLSNRTLWLDESFLAVNIINRSFTELLQPLEYNQVTPIGFLLLEKIAVHTFGSSEYSLRLYPLLAGITSLFLLYNVARYFIKPKAVLIALGLFAISGPSIYYSSEVKQYSTDVMMALLLFLLTAHIRWKGLTSPRIVLFGVAGAIAIWLSHPAFFVLAGLTIGFTLPCVHRKEWASIRMLSIAYSIWGLSIVVNYFVSLNVLAGNAVQLEFWKFAFMPLFPSSISDLRWFDRSFFGMLNDPVGLSFSGIAALTLLVGCVSVYSENRQNFLMLTAPAVIALLVSGVHKYPFSGRLLLFVVPFVLLLIGEGTEYIRDRTKDNAPVIGIALIGMLFVNPLLSASYGLLNPRTREEIRPCIEYYAKHQQARDILYVYYGARPSFRFYSELYKIKNNGYIAGIHSRDNWANYVNDLNRLRGNRRVWILFSHVFRGKGVDEEKLFLYELDKIGTRVSSFKSDGAAIYLYDLAKSGG